MAGARGVRTIVPQYDVRTTGQKGSKTYRKNRHGGDGDGEDGIDGNFDGDVMARVGDSMLILWAATD